MNHCLTRSEVNSLGEGVTSVLDALNEAVFGGKYLWPNPFGADNHFLVTVAHIAHIFSCVMDGSGVLHLENHVLRL